MPASHEPTPALPAEAAARPGPLAGDYFIADDLSGALDAAAAFHAVGKRVRIRLDPRPADPADADEILGYTTETRNFTAVEAASVVRSLVEEQARRGARLRYKKIDSTLRGPVGAEVAAVMDALPGVRILFNPANPAVGRTVENGLLQVNGVPVAETAFGRDPANPVRRSDVLGLLGLNAGDRLQVADAKTLADLERLVAHEAARGGSWVAVGSGALARPVARLGSSGRSVTSPALGQIGEGFLVVCGSAHPINRTQIIQGNEDKHFDGVVVDPRERVAFDLSRVPEGRGVVLRLPEERLHPVEALAALVRAAVAVIRRRDIRRLFVTGGETAFALARALGEQEFLYRGEVEPGLSLSSTAADGPRLWAVKPGGFRDAETWGRALRALAVGSPSS